MEPSVTPAWLSGAAQQLLNRFQAQRSDLCGIADPAVRCAAIAALYKREARVWRVLQRHANDWLLMRAALDAEMYAKDSAREYYELAEFWRNQETRKSAPVEGVA